MRDPAGSLNKSTPQMSKIDNGVESQAMPPSPFMSTEVDFPSPWGGH